jgi:peptidoglycan LD-endopeptidase CwlK
LSPDDGYRLAVADMREYNHSGTLLLKEAKFVKLNRAARAAFFLPAIVLAYFATAMAQDKENAGNVGASKRVPEALVVDSAMTENEAFDGLDPACPDEIRRRQRVVEVLYLSFDGKIHKGQIVVDQDLVDDVKRLFDLSRKEGFPIHSVIPASHSRFRKDGRWDDELSMAANNTSAFNFRARTGGKKLSNHAYGRALDINPLQNPYLKGEVVLPRGANYDPSKPGTLTLHHAIVEVFLVRGWEWGGNWKSLKDYQHLEKPAADAK